MNIVIRMATIRDLDAITVLIEQAGLNQAGIEENLNQFLIAENIEEEPARIVGVAGIEIKEDNGFLRSFVMESESWNAYVGLDFIVTVLGYAKQQGCKNLYLLTNPLSEPFFKHLGFQHVDLSNVPTSVINSSHFKRSYKQNVLIMKG